MKLRDKWEHKTIESNKPITDMYDRDDTVGAQYYESPLKKALIGSAIVAGGVVAYKSGMLKGGIKQMFTYASKYKAYTPAAMGAYKGWFNKDVDVAVNSMFRGNVKYKDVFKDKDFIKTIYKDTKTDMKDLKSSISKRVKDARAEGHDITKRLYSGDDTHGTKLIFGLNTIDSIVDQIHGTNSKEGRKVAKRLMNEKLINKMTLTSKEAKTQLKRTGYKTATLDDLLHIEQSSSGVIFASKHPDIELDNKTKERLKGFLGTTVQDSRGKEKTLLESGRWKNIILDDNIMIAEGAKGKGIDMRNANRTLKNFTQSLAKDYQIPLIGMNPLRMFGLDTIADGEKAFAIFHQGTIQPSITGKAGRVHLNEVDSIGKNPLIGIDGDVFKFSDDMTSMEKIASNKKFHLVNGEERLSREVHDYRKMANLNTKDYVDYEKGDGVKYYTNKVARKLDIGFQDKRIDEVLDTSDKLNFRKWLNPNTYVDATGAAFGKFFHPYKDTSEDVRNLKTLFGSVEQGEDLYFATNKSFTFKDAFNKDNSTTIKDVFSQLIAGRKGENMSDHITSATTVPYFLLGRINDSMASFGMGLSNESMGSTFDIGKNFIMKRALPVWGAYQGMQYVNYLSEGLLNNGKDGEDEDNPNNITKVLAKGVVKLDMGWHNIKDTLGVTGVAKTIADLTPGSDQLGEVPVLGMLDLTHTAEERDKYWREGETAVRKGRYWDLGNTAFTGGKIMYYQPNWYRRTMADVDFSDVKYGSRKEYFDNAIFPTITAPLAPIRHLFTDRYHYENKHYEDRPYLMSSPEFENIPLIGPVLGATLGQLIKPSKAMHQEYWQGRHPVALDDMPSDTSDGGSTSNTVPFNIFDAVDGVADSIKPRLKQKTNMRNASNIALGNARIGPYSATDEVFDDKYNEIVTDEDATHIDKIFDDLDLFTTSGGGVQVVNGGGHSIDSLNEDLKSYSLKKIVGTSTRIDLQQQALDARTTGEIAQDPSNFKNTLFNQLQNTGDVAGMYGFGVTAFVLGNPGAGSQQIETSGFSMSFNKTFWDAEIGGLGSEMSEIFRRFVPNRRKDVDYFNPVKNNMATWLPGQDYFTDFQHGDPYMKIGRGEMRLPGEGYERLWGLSDPTAMGVNTKYIGKSKEDTVKHFLHQDTSVDVADKQHDSLAKKVRAQTLKQWDKSGLAIDIKGTIKDKSLGITGEYDAIIHDETSDNGQAVADIQTVSDADFKKIKKSGDILDEHKQQINYAMYATKNNKGYVHYINEDDSKDQITIGTNYSQLTLLKSMHNLKSARRVIKKKLDNNEIGKGDLYSQIDRFRILADTSPYSKEFQEQDAVISRMKLSSDEEEQVSEIRQRVKDVKEPMRLYQYRFKTADVNYETVHVTKVLDDNTFMTAENPDNPIRLAGIHVSSDKTNKDRKEIDKTLRHYIHAGQELKIAVSADETERVANDSLNTIHAVVYSHGDNVNKTMLKLGYAKEKPKDWSATGVHARFNSGQIAFGKVWESIAHLDTFFNTKFLQVRSAKENYERNEVYGKNFMTWEHPVKDFMEPIFQANIHRPLGIVMGALVGGALGKTPYARVLGAVAGGGTVAIGKIYAATKTHVTGEEWVPKRRVKERDLTEYMDMLNFVKNKRLYHEYSDKALAEDNVDVTQLIADEKANGDKRKARIKALDEVKRQMKLKKSKLTLIEQNKILGDPLKYNDEVDDTVDKSIKLTRTIKNAVSDVLDKQRPMAKIKAGFKGVGSVYNYITDKVIDTKDEKFNARLKAINKEINEIQQYRSVQKTSVNATKAIYYQQKAEETMYGYDPGEPLSNILKAMPKKDREYMKHFIKAPSKERKDILKMVPKYMRRPLQSAWGMKVDEKEDAVKYFSKHALPDKEWVGWKEDKDLDSVKVKMVNHTAQDYAEFNMWQQDVEKANNIGAVPLPKVNFRTNADEVRYQMMDMLGSMGMKDINVSYNFSGHDANVQMDVKEDKREEVQRKLKKIPIR